MVEISASFPTCARCRHHINGGWAQVTNEDGQVILCYDRDKVSCYDHWLMDREYGAF